MAELLVQDTSIIATADAIREKMDSTDLIEWVANKGFADAISALVAFPEGVNAIASGTYTPTQTKTSPVAIKHGMNVRPNLMFILPESVDIEDDAYYATEIRWQITFDQNTIDSDGIGNGGVYIVTYSNNFSGRSGSYTTPKTKGGADDTNCYFYSDGSDVFKVGTTYRWIAANITRT